MRIIECPHRNAHLFLFLIVRFFFTPFSCSHYSFINTLCLHACAHSYELCDNPSSSLLLQQMITEIRKEDVESDNSLLFGLMWCVQQLQYPALGWVSHVPALFNVNPFSFFHLILSHPSAATNRPHILRVSPFILRSIDTYKVHK